MKIDHTTARGGRIALFAGVGLAALALGAPAYAQSTDDSTAATTEADASQSSDAPAIIVTGSRIQRNSNLDSSAPITSVSGSELLDNGNLSLGDALNELPSLRATYSQANSTRFIGTAGLSLLDLRGLGTDRTLVLVNGRRHVTSTPGSFTVDVNTIPSDLLLRTEVITGGNSAIYGSDAVSGVVNFILRDDFEGFRIRGQGGISDEGDRGSYFISGIAGKNFAEGRGNITAAFEYSRSNPVYFADRPYQTGAFDGPPGFNTVDTDIGCATDDNGNPIPGSIPFCDPNVRNGSDTIPDTAFFDYGSKFGIISLGGTVLTSCPAASATNGARREAVCTNLAPDGTSMLSPTGGRLSDNYVFLPDGTLVRDPVVTDLRNVGGGRFGGLTATGIEGAMLMPGLERYSGSVMAKFEVTPAFTPFFEGKYVKIKANQTSTQPTFVNSALSPSFSINNPFLTEQARETISLITGGASRFTMFRFNNDIGTRAEDHERETYRFVGGIRGEFGSASNWRYELAANYGRTKTFYETGGNVLIDNFNRATNAVLNGSGNIVCAVNADADTENDDAACAPLNLFGEGAPSQEALDYILYTSSRKERATQLQVTAFVSGDTTGFFELPGGAISVAVGAEYRKETAYAAYDAVTQAGETFLNSSDPFDPPTYSVKEAFGELRIPILADMDFFEELTIDAAVRASDYNFSDDLVWAYNAGIVWSPIEDIRIRGGIARSVRAPNMDDLYATRSETFANNFQDPCDQRFIGNGPNRAARCAEAGIPTTLTLPDGTVVPWTNVPNSGLSGFNQGNSDLQPEKSDSFTVGAVFQPSFLPGFSLTVDYYNIKIKKAISGLTGQAIANRCYDDPNTLDNPYCAAIFRRSSADPYVNFTFDGQAGRRFDGFPEITLPVIGPAFLNQPFNYQSLKTSGVDFDATYRTDIGNVRLDIRAIASYLIKRENYIFISEPDRSERVHGTLGDPEWQGSLSADLDFGDWDLGYDMRFIDRMTIGAWETQFSHQGRDPTNADAFPVTHYPRTFYHDIRFGMDVAEDFRFYAGVDNVFDTLPPYGLTGTGAGSGVYSTIGRFFYAGFQADF